MSKIIVVDDSYAELQMIEGVLKGANHTVISYPNAEKLEEKLAVERPDLMSSCRGEMAFEHAGISRATIDSKTFLWCFVHPSHKKAISFGDSSKAPMDTSSSRSRGRSCWLR